MQSSKWIPMVALTLVFVLALSLGAPRPSEARDFPKILAGVAVGALVYTALDSATRSSRATPYQSYKPPRDDWRTRSAPPKQIYDQGYRDGWRDGENYGYNQGVQRGYDWGWRDGARYGYGEGYREGYSDGSWRRGPSYNPPSPWRW